MRIVNYIRHKYAATEQGARDLIRSCLLSAAMDVVLMLPVALIFLIVRDLTGNGITNPWSYVWKIVAVLLIIMGMAWIKYNKQFISVYQESGRRRIALAEKLRKLPLSFFARKDLADLTSTIMADAAAIETGTSHFVPDLVGSMISILLIGSMLFFFDWRMALAAVWVIPIAICVVLFSAKFQNAFSRKQNQAKLDLADHIQEGLETFQDIRSCDAEKGYLDDLYTRIDLTEKRALQAEMGMACFVVSGQMILRVGVATTVLVGANLLVSGSLDLLTFFVFLLVASRLYDPLSGALMNLSAVLALNIPSERMDEILNHEEQTGEEKLTNRGYDIEFRDVHFAYDTSETVLNGVSFVAKQGEVTAIIGPSGSGKTTISRLAARFWDIDSGQITVGGMDVSKVDPETLMNLYSIVFQDVTLFNNTVLENIRIGRKDATDEEVIAAAKLAHVDVFAEKLPNGWNTLIGENGSELSGGERQRLSIARAFLKDAPIILLDEATASLDVENETFIQESLSRLVKDKTVIIIAHRMRTVSGADKIVVLENGKVSEIGTPTELTQSGGFYKRMQDIQQNTLKWQL
ncbi:MAG: ABC transporter ATP-binding protein/permease [Paludibacteraceae bacterium]|nr:ABC transporter ATP-binding protein/permease [Paludibacteraceae bacterium]